MTFGMLLIINVTVTKVLNSCDCMAYQEIASAKGVVIMGWRLHILNCCNLSN